MLRISSVSVPLGYSQEDLFRIVASKLRIPAAELLDIRLVKTSIDARDKRDVHPVLTVDADVKHENQTLKRQKAGSVITAPVSTPQVIPHVRLPYRPIIVGLGPAGLFAALILAEAGTRPILIERGEPVEKRILSVERFTETGHLNPESNVQFGEGGAGTFSDGKLTTGIKNPWIGFVLQTFVRFGAPEAILTDQKPHIGTDVLRPVIRAMRESILQLGGEVRFETRMDRLLLENCTVRGILVSHGGRQDEIPGPAVLLCIGHSSRDTVETLYGQQIPMVQKPFAMGLRIEHRQQAIDRAQYGSFAGHPSLPVASYKLHVPTPDGRGVYTFCMCPGGQVMAASSEPGRLCVNGMSLHARNGENANSALLVGIPVEDFPDESPLSGIFLQRSLEEKAYHLGGGGYVAGAQRVEDFLARRSSRGFGEVTPSYRPGVTPVNLHTILPAFMSDNLIFGIRQMDRQLHGFAHPDAVLTGVEARSSSPVRIPRTDTGEAEGIAGLYPCGEGAGYAGGIVSAAVDGICQAMKLLEKGAETA